MLDLDLVKMANAIRILTVDAVAKANSGHPGMPLGMADVATVLFTKFLKFNAQQPKWQNRDRFILSVGHGSMLLYSLLYLTGYKDFPLEELKNFRQLHAKTAGHPEYGNGLGIENTSGPLGQGLGIAIGVTLAERILGERFGHNIINYYTYALCGDGCLMEGISHEAASFAGHLALNKLILFFDDNEISIDGKTSLAVSDQHIKRFESYNWHVQAIDGHNFAAIEEAIINAQRSAKPSIICCKTIIGKYTTLEGQETAHSGSLLKDQITEFKKKLEYEDEDFFIPEEILQQWRSTSKTTEYEEWKKILKEKEENNKEFAAQWRKTISGQFLKDAIEILNSYKKKLLELLEINNKGAINKEATRQSSGKIINYLTKNIAEMIGGSADLTKSNNVIPYQLKPISASNYNGNYIYYGVREHFMAACMNGLALSGGILPYGGTFFVFSDYLRPALRMAAIMGLQVIYIMTHDSIGVGEDGPTHQPIEHLASFRAMPNVYVFRPADNIETLECWQQALAINNAPSIMILSRQEIKFIKRSLNNSTRTNNHINNVSLGAYILREAKEEQQNLQVTLIATGSEVEIAAEAQIQLENLGISTRLISMPCTELFDQQPKPYIDSLLKNNSLKVAIEAGAAGGWHKYIGFEGLFIGLNSFGASGPYKALYKYFNITAEAIVENCLKRLRN